MKKLRWGMLFVSMLLFSACSQSPEEPTEETSYSEEQVADNNELNQLAKEYPDSLLAWTAKDQSLSFDYEEFTVNQYNQFIANEDNIRGKYAYDQDQNAAVHITYVPESVARKLSEDIDRKDIIKDGEYQAISVSGNEVVVTGKEELSNSRWKRMALMSYLNLKNFQRTNGGNERLPNEEELRFIQYEDGSSNVIKLYLKDQQLYGVGISNLNTPDADHTLYLLSNPSPTAPAEWFDTEGLVKE